MTLMRGTSSAFRAVLEQGLPALPWLVDLFMQAVAPNSVYGEKWNTFGWITLLGYVLMAFSAHLFTERIKYSAFWHFGWKKFECLE